MTTETKSKPKPTATDAAKKRTGKARQIVKDAVKAMAQIRGRIVSLRKEADELEHELTAMIAEFSGGVPPAPAPGVRIETRPDGSTAAVYPTQFSEDRPNKYDAHLNGRRIDAVVAPAAALKAQLDRAEAAMIMTARVDDLGRPLRDFADELGARSSSAHGDPAATHSMEELHAIATAEMKATDDEEPEDLRDVPMSVVLADCKGHLLSRLLSDYSFNGIETIGQLASWLQAEPGRSVAELLSRGSDHEQFQAAMFAWSSRYGFQDLTSEGLPLEWFPDAESVEATDPVCDRCGNKLPPAYDYETCSSCLVPILAGSKSKRSPPPDVVEIKPLASSKAPLLPTELQLKLRDALDPTWKNWDDFRSMGKIDDTTLLTAIGVQFAKHPKEKRGRHWSCVGGADPRFYTTASGYKSGDRKALKGTPLCDATRDVMQLTKP